MESEPQITKSLANWLLRLLDLDGVIILGLSKLAILIPSFI